MPHMDKSNASPYFEICKDLPMPRFEISQNLPVSNFDKSKSDGFGEQGNRPNDIFGVFASKNGGISKEDFEYDLRSEMISGLTPLTTNNRPQEDRDMIAEPESTDQQTNPNQT
jgi:hypothetical protein